MSRLVHSTGGNLRSMQISRKKFFVFVEGSLDRSFHDQLLRSPYFNIADDYEIRAARELPGGTGGKPSLINHFKLLKSRRSLSGVAFGKKYTSAFIFDKDIDDLSRKRLRSPHAIYTETYDLEGHLLECGDLVQAVAIAAGVTYNQARAITGSSQEFLRKAATIWSDWVALCIVSQLNSLPSGCTFDRPSPMNPAGLGPTDTEQRDRFLQVLAAQLGISFAEVSKKHKYYVSVVKAEITSGRPLKHFKGKWIKTILQQHTAPLLNVPDATLNALGERVLIVLLAQIAQHAQCHCCVGFHGAFAPLTDSIK